MTTAGTGRDPVDESLDLYSTGVVHPPFGMTTLRVLGRRPLGVMLLALTAAAILAFGQENRFGPSAGRQPRATAAIPAGYEAIRTETVTVDPGSSRTFDPHAGPHTVSVLAGTLALYDGDGRRSAYEPGQAYVAGWESYRASNEGGSPAQIAVTYIHRPEG